LGFFDYRPEKDHFRLSGFAFHVQRRTLVLSYEASEAAANGSFHRSTRAFLTPNAAPGDCLRKGEQRSLSLTKGEVVKSRNPKPNSEFQSAD